MIHWIHTMVWGPGMLVLFLAVATPAMFPVPMVAARAVHADWNGDIPPAASPPCMFSSLVPVFSGVFHRLPAVFFHHRKI